jgi:hypothetical protein
MSKTWTIILFAILMVVQTLSVASDVLPSHLGDVHHDQAHSHDSVGDLSPAADDDQERQGSNDLSSLPHHCHTNHCHGSHLLLAMHVFDLPLLISEQVVPAYIAQNTSAHIDTILRPPIA